MDTHFGDMGFTQSSSDPCIYYMNTGGDIFCLGVYVDDIILAGSSDDRIKEGKGALSEIRNKDIMGKLHHFLGISVVQDERRKKWIGQPAYTKNLLKKFEIEHCEPVRTPINAGSKLEIAKDKEECINQ